MAAVFEDMRRQDSRRARLLAQFHDQGVGRPMTVAARVFFVGNDHIPDERLNALGQSVGAVSHSLSAC
jgi:hypothetical protein